MKWVFPFAGVVLLSIFVMYRCHRIIKRNLKSTILELIRGEATTKREGHYKLSPNSILSRNLTMAVGELKCKCKEYIVIFLIFVFSSFLILLPMNMNHTIDNSSFLTYMGIGKSDIRIDIQYCDNLIEQKEAVINYLKNDSDIDQYTIYVW